MMVEKQKSRRMCFFCSGVIVTSNIIKELLHMMIILHPDESDAHQSYLQGRNHKESNGRGHYKAIEAYKWESV